MEDASPSNLSSKVVAVAAGEAHTLALTGNTTLTIFVGTLFWTVNHMAHHYYLLGSVLENWNHMSVMKVLAFVYSGVHS